MFRGENLETLVEVAIKSSLGVWRGQPGEISPLGSFNL